MKNLFSKIFKTNLQILKKWEFVAAVIIIIAPSIIYVGMSVVQSYIEYFVVSPKGMGDILFSWQTINFGQNNVGTLWRIFPLSAFYYLFVYIISIPPDIVQQVFLAGLRLVGFLGFIAVLKSLFSNIQFTPRVQVIAGLLFVYNLYTLNYFSSSYIVLVPYYFLPLQLLLLIKGINSKKFLQFGLLLALTNACTFGVNLVYDAIAIAMLGGYLMFSIFVDKQITIASAIKFVAYTATATGLFTVWWLFPMLYGNLIDRDTASFILKSENFYNLESSPINLLRGLGEWGFFSGYKGELYHNYARLYKDNAIVVFAGFFIAVLMFLGFTVVNRLKDIRDKRLVVLMTLLVLLLLPFIGGTNPAWPTDSLMKWAFENVPFMMAMRNTYKWMSLLIFVSALTSAIFLQISGVLIGKLKWFALPGLVALIIANTLPIWTGNVYQKSSVIDKVPIYWQEATSYINTKLDPSVDRILLLPNQYFSIYQWEGKQIQFPTSFEAHLWKIPVIQNTCNGCGQVNTSFLLEFIYKNMEQRNQIKLLGMINVTKIIERNDYLYSYYKVESPNDIKRTLYGQGLEIFKTFGKLDIYNINADFIYPRVYSPSKAISTSDFRSTLDIFEEQNVGVKDTAFILHDQNKKSNALSGVNLGYYDRLFTPTKGTLANNQFTQRISLRAGESYEIYKRNEFNKTSYNADYKYTSAGYVIRLSPEKEKIQFNGQILDNSDTNSNEVKEILLAAPNNSAIVAELDKNIVFLRPNKDWTALNGIILDANKPTSTITYSIDAASKNLMSNPSFENGLWNTSVSNCALTIPSADISAGISDTDVTDGKKAMRLSAKQDSACEYSEPIKNFNNSTTYFLSFDYKQVKGSAPAYCVWDGSGCAIYATAPKAEGWSTMNTAVKLNSTSRQFQLYIYSPKGNFNETENLIDNVQVRSLDNPYRTGGFQLQNQKPFSAIVKPTSENNSVTAKYSKQSDDKLDNGSFEDGLWAKKAGNCAFSSKATVIKTKRVEDATSGKYGLQLSASADNACMSSSTIKEFKSGIDYQISLDYKAIQGNNAEMCVWNGSECILREKFLTKDKSWHHFETSFTPEKKSQSLSVYLYAPAQKGKAIVNYDNVHVNEIKNKFVDAYSIRRNELPTLSHFETSFKKVNPTKYAIKLKKSNSGLIVLQESFHPGWSAKIKNVSNQKHWSVPSSRHIMVNGYANGWVLSSKDLKTNLGTTQDLEMLVEFKPQSYFYYGLAATGVGILSTAGYFIHMGAKRRKRKLLAENSKNNGNQN